VTTDVKYAQFWQRLLAHNIDLLPIIGLFYVATLLVPTPDHDYLLMGIIYMTYHIAFEISGWRATPGKRMTKIHVGFDQSKLPKFLSSSLRNLSKILSLIIFFGGFLLIIFDRRNRGLHDYIGGTLVLFDEE